MSARSRIGWGAAALAVAFAGVVAWARLGVERPEATARAALERESRVLDVAAGAVVGVEIAPRAGPPLRLVRDGRGWRREDSTGEPADPVAVEDFLDRLLAVRARRTLEPPPEGLASLGLDPPVSRVSLSLADGRRLSLDLGDENPFDRTRYARAGGAVRVVEGLPAAALDPVPGSFAAPPGAR